MTNTAARNYNTIEATEIVKNRIREHIREKEAVKSRLRRAIKFLFICDAGGHGRISHKISSFLRRACNPRFSPFP